MEAVTESTSGPRDLRAAAAAGGADSPPDPATRTAWTRAIKAEAARLGFDAVGVAPAGSADPDGHLRAWLDRGFGADMAYLADNAEVRADIRRYVTGAESVIALAMSYWSGPDAPREPGAAGIARYARMTDYHDVIRRKLRTLRRFMLRLDPGARVGPSIDFAPVLERAWAARAGIAWIGKSSMALSRELGTYTFLATVSTTTVLDYDAPAVDHCGTCTACLDACPTQAFVAPYVLDARRCITYWTIEHEGEPPPEAPDPHGWAAGCDVCQEVCPWNKFATPTREPRFAPAPSLIAPPLARLVATAPDPELDGAVERGPLSRIGREGLRRNALRVTPPGDDDSS